MCDEAISFLEGETQSIQFCQRCGHPHRTAPQGPIGTHEVPAAKRSGNGCKCARKFGGVGAASAWNLDLLRLAN